MNRRVFLVASLLLPSMLGWAGLSDFDASASLVQRGLVLTWLAVFFAGVLVSFTPCVYPMIPITLSIIGARSVGQHPLQGFLRSAVFVLGLAVVYTGLGYLGAKTGKLVGFMLQNKWFLGFLTLFFLAMGASMLGLFEIQLPPSLASRLQGRAGRGGYAGAFLLGLVTGVVASPCGSPVLFSVLTLAAQSGRELVGMSLLFAYALGIGLLFLILGTFPSFLRAMPKSGDWMEDVRIVLGLVLIGVALGYYAGFLMPPRWHALVLVAAGVAGAIFAALHSLRRREKRGLRLFWSAVALVLLAGGIYAAVTRNGGPAQLTRVASVDSQVTSPTLGAPSLQAATAAAHDDTWLTEEAEGLRRARETGKPLIIDFGAAWCAACKELEHKTFPHPEVAALLTRFVKVRIDCTEETPENEKLREKYGALSLPTVVLASPDGTVAADLTLRRFEEPTQFAERLRKFLSREATKP